MGFFSKLFSVDKCPTCGSTDMKTLWNGRSTDTHTIYECRNCGEVSLHHKAPLCAACGKPQTGIAYNENGVAVPLCEHCGHKWDNYEKGWVNLD